MSYREINFTSPLSEINAEIQRLEGLSPKNAGNHAQLAYLQAMAKDRNGKEHDFNAPPKD